MVFLVFPDLVDMSNISFMELDSPFIQPDFRYSKGSIVWLKRRRECSPDLISVLQVPYAAYQHPALVIDESFDDPDRFSICIVLIFLTSF